MCSIARNENMLQYPQLGENENEKKFQGEQYVVSDAGADSFDLQ